MNPKPAPARSVPPGRILKKEIEARGWTQADLATILGRPEQAVSEIVQGRKQITPETAMGLAQAFGTSAELWLNLEARYRLAEARKASQDNHVSRRSRIYSLLPVRELRSRGWIADEEDTERLEHEVRSFLGVTSLDDIPALKIAARRTVSRTPDQRALLAWVRRVEELTAHQQVPPFDPVRLEAGITELLSLSAREEDVRRVPDFVCGLGVHMVIVHHLPRTYLDGAVLETEGNPVIALTLRHDRLDNFWFTLIHELEHLARGHTGSRLENLDEDAAEDPEEVEADAAAGERLVPGAALARYVKQVKPYFSRHSIEAFGRSIGRHPAIILGRLQHDEHVSRAHLRGTIPKVRRLLDARIDVPSQVRDGSTAAYDTGRTICDPHGDQAMAALEWLCSNPGWHSPAELMDALRFTRSAWARTSRALLASGQVERSGVKRGTRYRMKE